MYLLSCIILYRDLSIDRRRRRSHSTTNRRSCRRSEKDDGEERTKKKKSIGSAPNRTAAVRARNNNIITQDARAPEIRYIIFYYGRSHDSDRARGNVIINSVRASVQWFSSPPRRRRGRETVRGTQDGLVTRFVRERGLGGVVVGNVLVGGGGYEILKRPRVCKN